MNNFDLRQTIGILANLGVVLGILLLVYELAQNRQMMRAQTRHAVSQGVIDQFSRVAENPEYSELVREGFAGELRSDEDRYRYNNHLLTRFRYWEDVHFQYRMGLFDEMEFEAAKRGWSRLLVSKAVQNYWQTYRSDYSVEFAAEIDGIIAGLGQGE